jgi:hypothetical protein
MTSPAVAATRLEIFQRPPADPTASFTTKTVLKDQVRHELCPLVDYSVMSFGSHSGDIVFKPANVVISFCLTDDE